MAILHIREIPESRYARLKALAQSRGKSLTDLVSDMIVRELAENDQRKKLSQALEELEVRHSRPTKLRAVDLVKQARDEMDAR